MERNTLYYGDNLGWLCKSLWVKSIAQGFIDLDLHRPSVQLARRNYNILYEDMIQDASNGGRNTALKRGFSRHLEVER